MWTGLARAADRPGGAGAPAGPPRALSLQESQAAAPLRVRSPEGAGPSLWRGAGALGSLRGHCDSGRAERLTEAARATARGPQCPHLRNGGRERARGPDSLAPRALSRPRRSRSAGADVIPGQSGLPAPRPSRAFLRQGIPAPARSPRGNP